MSTLIGQDRNGDTVEIGDVVMVIDQAMPIELAVIVDFQYPFVDPIILKFAGGFEVHRMSLEIEKTSNDKAVLWKLENL
jgi:hypothetical protein